MAFSFDSFAMPKLMIIVITAGKLSGIAATEIATAVRKALRISFGFATTSKTKVTLAISKIRYVKIFPIAFMSFCSFVKSFFVSLRLSAIFPISVCVPSAQTIPFPCPSSTTLPEYATFFLSARATSLS